MRSPDPLIVLGLLAIGAAPGPVAAQSSSVVSYEARIVGDRATVTLSRGDGSQFQIQITDASIHLPALDRDVNPRADADLPTLLERLRRGGVSVHELADAVGADGLPADAWGTPAPDAPTGRSPAPRAPRDGDAVSISLAPGRATLLSVMSVFVALSAMAYGMMHYAPRQLEIVTRTVRIAFGRSFVAGVLVQPLTPAALALGALLLAITVVGVLLIPVLLAAAALLIFLAAAAGYLAVARVTGERMLDGGRERGEVVTKGPFRTTIYGLAVLLTPWLPAALLGWVPMLGDLLHVFAAIFTWGVVSAGLGATTLSQAALRSSVDPPLTLGRARRFSLR